jgi:hypothetical protein
MDSKWWRCHTRRRPSSSADLSLGIEVEKHQRCPANSNWVSAMHHGHSTLASASRTITRGRGAMAITRE